MHAMESPGTRMLTSKDLYQGRQHSGKSRRCFVLNLSLHAQLATRERSAGRNNETLLCPQVDKKLVVLFIDIFSDTIMLTFILK